MSIADVFRQSLLYTDGYPGTALYNFRKLSRENETWMLRTVVLTPCAWCSLHMATMLWLSDHVGVGAWKT